MNYRRLFLFVWVSALLLPCTLRADDNLYRIGSAEELESFAGMLNADNSGPNAVLTADIDYTGHERVVGENCWYTGTFDGQGHTITIDLSTSTDNYGFFKSIGETGTVKNLVLAGTLATSGKNAGAFSGICSGRITNCISRVTIESSHYGDSGHGGFVGMTANNAYITNCISAGRFLSDASTHCGGFVGWKGWGTTIIENCLEIMDVNLPTTDGCHAFGRGGYDGGNNYYLTDMGSNGAATLVTEDELADGAVCFKLNGDQSAINFYQTLGQDLYPVPFATSKRVYASGTFNCDGVTPVGEATYSNESGDVTILDHSYQDGVCQECGHVDMGYCSQEDGFYLVGNGSQLNWITHVVTNLNQDVNVRLTDDIDYTAYQDVIAYDTWYTGTFDGQGHTITIDLTGDRDYMGLFFRLGGAAVIENLTVDGTLTTKGKNAGGLCGWDSGTIRNCTSRVTINALFDGDCGHGGFAGFTFDNAYFYDCLSQARFEGESAVNCGGYVGWHGWGTTWVENCLEIMEVELPTAEGCSPFVRGGYTGRNNYCLSDLGDKAATLLQPGQMAGGEACYRLNGDQKDIQWYQNIGQDDVPQPYPGRGQVYLLGSDTYMDVHDDASFQAFRKAVPEVEAEYAAALLATASLADEYTAQLSAMAGEQDRDQFMDLYAKSLSLKSLLQASAKAYRDYQEKVDYVTAYLDEHDGFAGPTRQVLETYLYEDMEPGGDYPNGSYPYIIRVHALTTDEVNAEALYVQALLDKAIAEDYAPGTDVTKLLANAGFESGFDGWEGTAGTATVKSPATGLTCAEARNKDMDMYQELGNLKDGIYLFSMSATSIVYNDIYNTNYRSSIYAGDNMTYIPMSIENVLPADEAVDGENCNLTGKSPDYEIADDEGQALGYAIGGALGLANAAGAGRSVACIAARAEDGVLRVGVRHEATGSGSDWTALANVSLTYLGTPEEAAGRLREVLDGQVNRARTLLDYVFSDGADYREFPNFMQLLRDELRAEIDEASAATDGEARYELIGRFSKTFADIYASKQAYVSMLDMMEELTIVAEAMYPDNISEEDFQAVLDVAEWAWDGYANGTISTDEALSLDCLKDVAIAPVVEDGVYQIGNYGQMLYFVNKVNSGKDAADARLTRDVDFSGNNEQIAKGGFYNGTFDGQGHHLTIRMDGTSDAMGLFFRIGDAGTVRNLVIDGTVTTSGKNAGGLCGWSAGTISHCVSLVTIASTHGGDSGHGGFVGQTFNNGTIEYCLSAGRFLSDYSTNCGGFVGWNGWGSTNISHCLQIMDVELPSVSGSHAIGRGGYTGTNNYYLTDLDGHGDAVAITQEQLGSGHVCYCLNGDQTDLNWFQTLGQDQYPVPFDTHLRVVLEDDGTYKNADSEDGVQLTQTSAEGDGRDSVYDLFGRKVGKAASRGIYIVNGKKVIMGR